MNCVEFSSHLGLLGYSQMLSESGRGVSILGQENQCLRVGDQTGHVLPYEVLKM